MGTNTLNDLTKWAGTPILSSSSLVTKDIENIRWNLGAPVNIGSAELQQSRLGDAIQPTIAAIQYNQSQIDRNVALSGYDPSNPDPSIGSLGNAQARMLAYKEFNITDNKINHFYTRMDRVYQNMVARMLRSTELDKSNALAVEWKRRCVEKGVPEEIFKDTKETINGLPRNLTVKATRVAGAGSQVGLLMGLQELQPIAGTFDVNAQREYKKLMVTAALGPEYISAFVSDAETGEGAEGNTIAGLENSIISMGKSPVFSNANDHKAHLGTHSALAVNLIELVEQQQIDYLDADRQFSVLIPHMTDHLNAAKQSIFLQGFADQFGKQMKDIVSFANYVRMQAKKQLRDQIAQQEQDAQASQQVMTDAQRKDFVAQKDAERNDFKVQSQAQRAEEASEVRAESLRSKTNADIQNKNRIADAEVAVKQKKASGTPTNSGTNIESPQEILADMQGETPSPYDFES
jgi:hypothetical protein